MNFNIDKDVIAQASKCRTSLACLNDKGYKVCKVDRAVNGGGIIFVECQETRNCDYKNSYGYSLYFCNCPVRKEIYKKYGC